MSQSQLMAPLDEKLRKEWPSAMRAAVCAEMPNGDIIFGGVLEEPPRVRLISELVPLEDEGGHYYDEDLVTHRLSFPYVVTVFIAVQSKRDRRGMLWLPLSRAGNIITADSQIWYPACFATSCRNRPLQNWNNMLCELPLLNGADGIFCLGDGTPIAMEMALSENGWIAGLHEYLQRLWSNSFTHGHYEPSETSMKLLERLGGYAGWEEKTKKNPSFVLKQKWYERRTLASELRELLGQTQICMRAWDDKHNISPTVSRTISYTYHGLWRNEAGQWTKTQGLVVRD